MAKGGSISFSDITNLAVPFGLLLAAHGVGALAEKVKEKKGKGSKGSPKKGGAKAKAKAK